MENPVEPGCRSYANEAWATIPRTESRNISKSQNAGKAPVSFTSGTSINGVDANTSRLLSVGLLAAGRAAVDQTLGADAR
jgi:hypothetical protein